MTPFKRIHLIVLDSVGIGAAPDAKDFFNASETDAQADTLGNIAQTVGLSLPCLTQLGLGCIKRPSPLKGIEQVSQPKAYVTKLKEVSLGKDTMTGHWELMGLNITEPFDTFWQGFPEDLIQEIEAFSKRKVIREANKPYSGTAVIEDFGARQMETGELIVYTSADPVLQIAAHEEVIPLEELYRICEFVRSITLQRPRLLGRIIARPYQGQPKAFKRTANRRDYAISPFANTVLNQLQAANIATYGIGKISDIFNGSGISHDRGHTQSNDHGLTTLLETMQLPSFTQGLSFTNLVDFDAVYGHRRDPEGYRDCLEAFDKRLPEILEKLQPNDLLLITADHGNDPTYVGTDHTREYVPLVAYSPRFSTGGVLPVGEFADVSATIADNFSVDGAMIGQSFLHALH